MGDPSPSAGSARGAPVPHGNAQQGSEGECPCVSPYGEMWPGGLPRAAKGLSTESQRGWCWKGPLEITWSHLVT